MTIYRVKTGRLRTNTYIVANGSQSIVIDPGDDFGHIQSFLEEHALTLDYVLLTHEHYDHCNACKFCQERGAKVYMHETAWNNVQKGLHLAEKAGVRFNPFQCDAVLRGGETLELIGLSVDVLYTPGHTSGGVCYCIGHNLFSGDTLFRRDIGRTDLPTGDHKALVRSIKENLFTLKGNYTVYPGHEAETTLDDERANNPYVKG